MHWRAWRHRDNGTARHSAAERASANFRETYPGFLALVREAAPQQATLVPDSDGQVTSDHGFDLARDLPRLAPMVDQLKRLGVRVSVFVDAGATEGFFEAHASGIDRIEIYTGPYAEAFQTGDAGAALAACVATADAARRAGLGVNAGHDLDLANLGPFLRTLADVAEVSIGHALIDDALYSGLDRSVRDYLDVIAAATAQ